MKLNRDEMIRLCKLGIQKAQEDQITWDQKVDEAEAEWERQWREVHLPAWREFRDKLTQALRTGGPITLADLPINTTRSYDWADKTRRFYRPFNRGCFEGYTGNKRWRADHDEGPRPTADIGPFEVLLAFLEAVAEDTVTTGQLEAAGFRNLNKLITAATSGAWK